MLEALKATLDARASQAAGVACVSVHDGDTLWAIGDGQVEQRIRLAGIDAPERLQQLGNVARDRPATKTICQATIVDIEGRDHEKYP